MSAQSVQRFVLIGLPSTGKTSFLAALWYMVNQPKVECALTLDKLEGDAKYVNQIRDSWLEYKPVPRNPSDSEKMVSMYLKERSTDKTVELAFPDLSGESFSLQWADRQFTIQYDRDLRDARGAILFVHPNHVSKPHRIDAADALVAAISAPDSDEDEGGLQLSTNVKPWDIEKAPTQVKLVELLQFIANRDTVRSPLRVAIVVSAWDLVSDMAATAGDWISSELPLLQQYLLANEDRFIVEHFGISAQGGRYASSLFIQENFRNPQAFALALSQRGTLLNSWLWEQIDESTQMALVNASSSEEQIATDLVRNFNVILAKPPIYDEELFKSTKLRAETREMLQSGGMRIGEDSIRLNRMLLEDTFPTEIVRTRQYATEAAALQKKPPARRIIIVGRDIVNSHDITIPVQWLMQ